MNELISEILATIFISLGVIYYNNHIGKMIDEKQFIVKSIFLILFIMILLFVSDKVFFANRQLLSKEGSVSLFALIEKLMLIMFGYYFGKNN
jgi:hypothetical protein